MGRLQWAHGLALSAIVGACGGTAFTTIVGDGGGGGDGSAGSSSGASSSGASSSGGGSGSSSGGSGSGGSSGASSSGASGSGGGSGSSSGASGSGSSSSGGCAGGSCDAAPPSVCPVQAPAGGTSCTVAGLECEYGTNPVLGCNTLATCTQSAWVITVPSSSTNCTTTRAASCPFTFATVPQGGGCVPSGLLCGYPAGRCECAVSGGVVILVDGSASATWQCQAPGPSCPMPRAPLGTPCAPAGLSCDYGECYVLGGSSQTCTGGIWKESFVPCPAVAGATTN